MWSGAGGAGKPPRLVAGIWVAFFKSASNIVDRWVGFLVGEVVELADSTSIKVYLSLSGNQGDAAINATIALALLCRAGAGGLVALGHDDAATTMYGEPLLKGQQNGSKAKHHLSAAGRRYSAMMWIMMLGLFCLSMRLLTFSSARLRFGIIRIVFLRIVERDVIPFLVYLVIGKSQRLHFCLVETRELGY